MVEVRADALEFRELAEPQGRVKPWSVRQTLCLRFLMVAVAHQVEHRIVAPEVAGSRPVSHPTSLLTPTQTETTKAQALSRGALSLIHI